MHMKDKADFAEMMVVLSEYYGKAVSDAMIEMYWQGLQMYDIQAIREAFNRHVANPDSGQWMPKIADVAKMLGGTSQDAALQAWAKVDKAIRHVGTYSDVAFDDPLIHRVIHDMGGWIGFGAKTEDEWPFVAKEFENRYRGYRMRSERPDYPKVLTGISNAHNSRNGHKLDAPRLIGNVDKATRVISGGTDKPLIGITSASDQAPRLRLVKDDGEASA